MSKFKQYMSIINEMKVDNKGVKKINQDISNAWRKFIKSKKQFAKDSKSLDKIPAYSSYNAGKLTPKEIKEIRFSIRKEKPELVDEFIKNKDKYGLNLKTEEALKEYLNSDINNILKDWDFFYRNKIKSFFEIKNLLNNKTTIEEFTNQAKEKFIKNKYPSFQNIAEEILSTDEVKKEEKIIQYWARQHAGLGHGP
jgi:hypothetical protein